MPDALARFPVQAPYDLWAATRFLRLGGGDPTFRRTSDGFLRAARYHAGPATLRAWQPAPDEVAVEAWGPGAAEAVERAPRLVGAHESPWRLDGHPAVRAHLRDHPGLRLTDTHDVFEALLGVVLQQLVTWEEAVAAFGRLVRALGEPAPGPGELLLPPTPRAVRDAGTARLVSFGMAETRARTLQEVASYARRLQQAAELPTDEALAMLQKARGVGPWTASYVLGHRLGRPDVVLVGDLHLPHSVAWALRRVERGTDAEMLDDLAAFPGQPFRVLKLLLHVGEGPPRRGPKPALWGR